MSANTKAILTLTAALSLTSAAVLFAQQQPINKMLKSSTSTATIEAIDSTARTVVLRDESGDEDTYSVGPQMTRFDELKVGQKVKTTYNDSVVLQIRKSGEPNEPSVGVAGTSGTGALPSGTMAVQAKATVTVKAIDPNVPSITVSTADGRTVTRKVDDKKNLTGVAVGDLIDITYTRAVLISVESAK
jgi:hypothetical protein